MPITVQEMDHEIWGPCVFLEAEGEAEAILDEYARKAPGWPPLHFAITSPEGVGPWYRLGFAQMHAYGKRASGAERVELPDVTLRRGVPADRETAIRFDRVIYDVQATAVLPEAQGRGIGRVLTTHALAHAHEQGYQRMWTNWRVTNLRASRYWPARGFEIARIRLVRQVPAL